MKRLLLLVIVPWWAASAALPSLTQLADDLANIRERVSELTNLSARAEARIDALTNLAARMEAAWNATQQGRRALHGAPSYRYDTNEVTRVIQRLETYPDGYVYEQPGTRTKALAPAEIAEREEWKRNAPQRRAEALRQSIAYWDEQAAIPQTNDTAVIAAAHARINAARQRKALERLLAQSATNEVTVTVSPQTQGGE